jgi:hypothetical protein
MICYIPGCICYGSENFGLGSLHDDYVGLAGATPQFYFLAQYRFDDRFVDELFTSKYTHYSRHESICRIQVGMFHLFIGHEGPQGEETYSSTLFLTSAL